MLGLGKANLVEEQVKGAGWPQSRSAPGLVLMAGSTGLSVVSARSCNSQASLLGIFSSDRDDTS